ncbi:MAG: flagella basal body P-ring formation protein FlgA [Spirochaetota bacterium]
MNKLILTSVLFLCAASAACADVRIYLYPRCEAGKSSVSFSSAAWVEGDEDDAAKVRAITVDERFYKDGYIDSSEIRSLLKSRFAGKFSIIGTSVRIFPPEPEKVDLDELALQSVKKGEGVTVVVKRKGITLETHGIAADDALPGDEISVEIGKKKIVKGVLREEHVVEVLF